VLVVLLLAFYVSIAVMGIESEDKLYFTVSMASLALGQVRDVLFSL
jgi:hypothetical protein